jgi:hypothetical protein
MVGATVEIATRMLDIATWMRDIGAPPDAQTTWGRAMDRFREAHARSALYANTRTMDILAELTQQSFELRDQFKDKDLLAARAQVLVTMAGRIADEGRRHLEESLWDRS